MTIKLNEEKFFSLLLALSPFLINYNIPILNINITFLIYMILALFAFLNIIMNDVGIFLKKIKSFTCSPLMVVMLLYIIFETFYVENPIGLVDTLMQVFLLYIQLFGFIWFFSYASNRVKYKNYVVNIALFMSFIVFIQYVLYYLFGYLPGGDTRTALIPFNALFSDSVIETSKQGMVINGFFRPSAMFLEPAHFSAYCSLGLVVQVFAERKIGWKSIIISLAICMTTSGMGIASVGVICVMYVFFDFQALKKTKIQRAFFITIVLSFIFVFFYFNFTFFRNAISRFFGTDNALSGRLSGRLFIDELQGKSRMFGVGYKNFTKFENVSYFFSALTELMYCQGMVGTIIFSVFYIAGLIKIYLSKNQEHTTAMVIGAIFFIGSDLFSAGQIIKYIPFLFK